MAADPVSVVLFAGVHDIGEKVAPPQDWISLPPGLNTFKVACARNASWPVTDNKTPVIRVRVDWSVDGGLTWEHLSGFRAVGQLVQAPPLLDDTESATGAITLRYNDRERLVRITLESYVNALETEIRFAADERDVTAQLTELPHSVAFDAMTTQAFANVASFSFSHSPSGTPTGIAVCVGNGDNGGDDQLDVTAITYGGSAMAEAVTKKDAAASTVFENATIWGLGNPSSGTQTVNITFEQGTQYGVAGAISVTGGDTSTVFSHTASASAATFDTASVTCTTAADELVIDSLCFWGASAPSAGPTVGANQTQMWNSRLTTFGQCGSRQSGADGGVMSWDATSSATPWVSVAASFKASGGGGGGAKPWFWYAQQGALH